MVFVVELKDSLSRMGADIKQKLMESVRNTWKSITQFAAAHRGISTETAGEQDPALDQVSDPAFNHYLSQLILYCMYSRRCIRLTDQPPARKT